MKHTHFYTLFLASSVCALLLACGRHTGGSSSSEGKDSDEYMATSVVNTIGNAAADLEIAASTTTPTTSSTTTTTLAIGIVPSGPELNPPTDYCLGSVSRSNCSQGKLSVQYGNCATAGNSWLDGSWTHSFSPTQACDVSRASGVVIKNSTLNKTTSHFVVHGTDSDLTISTDAKPTYDGSRYSGGIYISGTQGSSAIDIRGLYKTVVSRKHETLSDYTLHTDGYPVTVTGSRWDEDRAANGFVHVQDNLAHSSAIVTMANVQWGSQYCCYPTSGTVKIEYSSGSRRGQTSTLDFSNSTCGTATLSQPSKASRTVSLSLCEE